MSVESGIEKSIRRVITVVVYLFIGIVLYVAIRALAHWIGGVHIDLPNLSNHDFEWIVIFLLFVSATNSGGSCNCK